MSLGTTWSQVSPGLSLTSAPPASAKRYISPSCRDHVRLRELVDVDELATLGGGPDLGQHRLRAAHVSEDRLERRDVLQVGEARASHRADLRRVLRVEQQGVPRDPSLDWELPDHVRACEAGLWPGGGIVRDLHHD